MSLYRQDQKNQGGRIGRLEEKVEVTETAITLIETDKVDSDGGTFIVPTVDPVVAGAIWNNSGTLAISSGS